MATAGTEEDDSPENSNNKLFTRSRTYSNSTMTKKESHWKTERLNLLNIAKLCIKTLIESALEVGKVIGEEHEPFQQFFVIIENILRHGLKLKRNLLGQRRDYWAALEALEKIAPESAEITNSVRNLPSIKTSHGKGRAWTRLALMQKKLADYIRIIVENKAAMAEWYESHALLMQDEGIVISGLLVGINVIDCNFDLKGDNLDTWSSVLDLSLYLKDGNYLEKSEEDGKKSDTGSKTDWTVLIDQKTYLEEVNKSLSTSLAEVQNKMKSLQMTHEELNIKLSAQEKALKAMTEERDRLKSENEAMNELSAKKIQLAQADISVERETYQKSREGLNEMYDVAQKQLETEMQLRKETERELEMMRSMKEESEVAMRLLEKDIHDKQDTLIVLRRQLDDIKKINLDLHNKLQTCESSNRQHMEKCSALEENCARFVNQIKELEHRLKVVGAEKDQMMETLEEFKNKLSDTQSERSALETSLKIEREWRTNLQEELHKEKERIGSLQQSLRRMDALKKEYQTTLEKNAALAKVNAEQETALVEMGYHLSTSQQKVEEMKEVTLTMKEMKWTDDKEALNCQQCEQPFSLSRRKVHGHISSENTIHIF